MEPAASKHSYVLLLTYLKTVCGNEKNMYIPTHADIDCSLHDIIII
jgi:hypothetical protein